MTIDRVGHSIDDVGGPLGAFAAIVARARGGVASGPDPGRPA